MTFVAIRLLGLIFLISFFSCSSENTDKKLEEDRILLTKYKKQYEELIYMQKITKQNIPELVVKLNKVSKPREKGAIVTKIQRVEKKIKRYQEKANILKSKIIEYENRGVTPLQ